MPTLKATEDRAQEERWSELNDMVTTFNYLIADAAKNFLARVDEFRQKHGNEATLVAIYDYGDRLYQIPDSLEDFLISEDAIQPYQRVSSGPQQIDRQVNNLNITRNNMNTNVFT